MQRTLAAFAASAKLYQLPEQYIEKLSDYRDDVRGRYGRDLAQKYGDRQRCAGAKDGDRNMVTGNAVHARAELLLFAGLSALGTAKPVTIFLSAWDGEGCHHISRGSGG